jgi:putative GTP pyrophosphokinase
VPGGRTSHDGGVTDTSEQPEERRRDPVRRAVQAYAERQPELHQITERWVALVTTLLDDAGINYLTVTGRTKSVASFASKAARAVAGTPAHADPLTGITDQVGVRVVAYLLSEVEAVAELLADQFTILDDRDMGQETASQGRFGYASRHLLVSAAQAQGTQRNATIEQPASVQVRTVLQHAWAEFEHDIRYKGTVPAEHAPDLDRRFTLAAGLLELADREFSAIRARIRVAGPQQADEADADPRIAAHDLASFLTGQYADAGWSRTDHYAWISGLLLELGITSLDELAGLLTSVDSAAINARLEYKYPPGAVRRLDDALLAVFGTRYLDLHGNSHRRELLAARLEKLRAEDGDQPSGADPDST